MLRLKSLVTVVLFAIFFELTGGNSATCAQEIDASQLKAQVEVVTAMDLAALVEELEEKYQQYEQQLQSVLRTRLMEEKEFVARITLLIQQENLPKNLVDSAWLWVRKNRPGSAYPFVYFERVLRLEAEKAKVILPAFDRDIYTNRNAMRNRRLQQRFRR